jgi:KaiC/GvpD/RAD55 family RecA-like ATPase
MPPVEKAMPSASLETKVILQTDDTEINEEVAVEIKTHNNGGSDAMLVKLEDLVPKGFEVVEQPNMGVLEDTILYLNGKRLAPSEGADIKLIIKPLDEGIYELSPKLIYADKSGRQETSQLETKQISVRVTQPVGYASTGFKPLDDLLLGGIPENYAIILLSKSCDEKDLLIQKFLRAGIDNGEITFYVTTELVGIKDLTRDPQENLYMFICNPQAEAVVEKSPNVSILKSVENLTEINIALTSSFRKLGAKKASRRACIEIVSDVLLQHRAVQTRRWLAGLLPELKSEGFTTLMVMNPQMHTPEEVQAILGLYEGEISINETKNQKGTRRFLRINKMYNQRYLENEMPLEKEELRN